MIGITGKMPALQTAFSDSAGQVRNLVLFMRPQNPGAPFMAAWSKCSEGSTADRMQRRPAVAAFGEPKKVRFSGVP